MLGMAVNLVLGGVKLAGGIIGDSFALISDDVNSLRGKYEKRGPPGPPLFFSDTRPVRGSRRHGVSPQPTVPSAVL